MDKITKKSCKEATTGELVEAIVSWSVIAHIEGNTHKGVTKRTDTAVTLILKELIDREILTTEQAYKISDYSEEFAPNKGNE